MARLVPRIRVVLYTKGSILSMVDMRGFVRHGETLSKHVDELTSLTRDTTDIKRMETPR